MKTFFWVAVNLIGFFILVFMFTDTRKTHEKNNLGQKIFDLLQITLMLFLIFDTGMYLADEITNQARTINYLFSMLFYLFTPIPGFIFFLYCDYKMFNNEKGLKKRLKFYLIPIIINTLAVILTPFTDMLFIINENNVYSRGDYFWISIIAGFGYLAIYPLLILRKHNKQTLSPKGADIYFYLFPIPPIISAIIQIIYHGPLLLGICFVISAYFLYANYIQSPEDKRRLSVRINHINIAHFSVISFIMTSVILWSFENLINEIYRESSDINQIKLILPFIIIIALFIIFVFSTNRMTKRLFFIPLKLLVSSLLNMGVKSVYYDIKQQEIYGTDRDDEIGLLANTIQDLFIKGHYDELTGIYNRHYLETTMQQIMMTVSRINLKLTVMMIDVDFFKNYNDTYGHSEGDDCLRTIAQTLSDVITRKGDFIARYGGEEFAVILPNTNEAGARMIADKMLNAVRELKRPHESINGIVTISIGFTTGYQTTLQTWNDYVKKADEALYLSKNNGRNRYTYLSLIET